MSPSSNALWAQTIAGSLRAAGASQVVFSPGSRSTPLVLALDRTPGFTLWPAIDERSAAFFALGQSKATSKPTILVCTSGTAGAHYLPALIEARLASIPLVVLTADRPWELHGFGSPQTIDQAELFGRHVLHCEMLPAPDESPRMLLHLRALIHKWMARALAHDGGPIHFNVPFREPLSCAETETALPSVALEPTMFETARQPPRVDPIIDGFAVAVRPLIVCGPRETNDGFGQAVHALGRFLKVPVIAEAASNARFGHSESISLYDTWLRNRAISESHRPDFVVRFGGAVTQKQLSTWIDTSNARTVVVSERGQIADSQHAAQYIVEGNAVAVCQALMNGAPNAGNFKKTLGDIEGRVRSTWADMPTQFSEPFIAREIVAALPSGSSLFLSSSMPIRDVDAFAPSGAADIRVFANRGANGIDGIMSTAVGVSVGTGRPTVLMVGDVALLHDVSGWLVARDSEVPLVVVVINNDGGGIFHFLPVVDHTPHFERLFATPHQADLSHVARLAGAQYTHVEDLSTLRHEVATRLKSGRHLIEVKTERASNVQAHRAIYDRLLEALR